MRRKKSLDLLEWHDDANNSVNKRAIEVQPIENENINTYMKFVRQSTSTLTIHNSNHSIWNDKMLQRFGNKWDADADADVCRFRKNLKNRLPFSSILPLSFSVWLSQIVYSTKDSLFVLHYKIGRACIIYTGTFYEMGPKNNGHDLITSFPFWVDRCRLNTIIKRKCPIILFWLYWACIIYMCGWETIKVKNVSVSCAPAN